MADLKTSQFGTITAVQANTAGTEGFFPYVDPSQIDPDLRNKRMTRSEAKKFFGLDVFTALSGTSWDGSNKTLILTADTALTFSSVKRNGILRVKQDATGSHTLSINGVSVPVSSGANTITVITFFYDDVASTYVFSYDTNILGNVGGGGGDTTAPAIAAISVEDAEPNKVLLAYGETLDSGSVPANGDYVVKVNTVARTTTAVNITGANVKVTFDGAAVISTDTVTISYTPGSNPIEDAAGNDSSALTDAAVDNNVSAGVTGTVENLTLAAITGNITNSSQIFTPTNPTNYGGASWKSGAMDAKKIISGTSGRVWFKYVTAGDNSAMIGLRGTHSFTPGTDDFSILTSALYIESATNAIKPINGGTPGSALETAVAGTYYGIEVNLTTGAKKLIKSTDESTWTDITGGILTDTGTGDQSIFIFIYDDVTTHKISFPKGQNIS